MLYGVAATHATPPPPHPARPSMLVQCAHYRTFVWHITDARPAADTRRNGPHTGHGGHGNHGNHHGGGGGGAPHGSHGGRANYRGNRQSSAAMAGAMTMTMGMASAASASGGMISAPLHVSYQGYDHSADQWA